MRDAGNHRLVAVLPVFEWQDERYLDLPLWFWEVWGFHVGLKSV